MGCLCGFLCHDLLGKLGTRVTFGCQSRGGGGQLCSATEFPPCCADSLTNGAEPAKLRVKNQASLCYSGSGTPTVPVRAAPCSKVSSPRKLPSCQKELAWRKHTERETKNAPHFPASRPGMPSERAEGQYHELRKKEYSRREDSIWLKQ